MSNVKCTELNYGEGVVAIAAGNELALAFTVSDWIEP
jgi:hypothetical protein